MEKDRAKGQREPGIPIIYLASHSRSGSTLVGSVLGLADGHVYAGEIREVWRDGLTENQTCGCGVRFRDCPFWSAVFLRAFGGFDTEEVRQTAAFVNRKDSLAGKLGLLWLAWRFPRGRPDGFEDLIGPLGKLYASIRDVSGASIIVDTSKTMRYAALLNATPGLDVRMTNLIRDPRGIIYSRTQRARHRDGSAKPHASGYERTRVLRIIGKWAVRNAMCARVLRRDGGFRVLYEDFVADQSWYLKGVLGDGEARDIARRLAEGIGADVVQHQIAGNWVRGLKISPTQAWQTKLPWLPSTVARVLSAPLRWIYRSRSYE